ncbi:ABC transporter permease [Puia sp. P3]|uniref:ABC transporter permease n=1 Tax=Puia sp. P3 TaxID=3423952 RepID=UPI003D66F002
MVGVVKDFNFRSLHQRITPVIMVLDRMDGTTIVRVRTDDIPGVLASMRKSWNSLTAEAPFSWSFLDERYDQMYKNERHTGILLTIFAGLTIFVACLGLFGLATFTAEQRTKEIGIRKVLGADVKGIVALLAGGSCVWWGWLFCWRRRWPGFS